MALLTNVLSWVLLALGYVAFDGFTTMPKCLPTPPSLLSREHPSGLDLQYAETIAHVNYVAPKQKMEHTSPRDEDVYGKCYRRV